MEFEPVRESGSVLLVAAALAGIAVSALGLTKNPARIAARLDLLAGFGGLFATVAGAAIAGGPVWLSVMRFLVGALFLGVLTDTMLLGHWYLVQPGLSRNPLLEQIRWAGALWPIELAVWLLPEGMVSVFNGSVDDGQGGLLGWFWAVSLFTTAILIWASFAALKEKGYQAVMAVTGLAYLSLLTGFVADIMSRLALRPM